MTINTPTIFMLPDGRMDRRNAAAYLGLSVKTLAMHATRGTGPKFIKRGRVWYYKTDLDAWLGTPAPYVLIPLYVANAAREKIATLNSDWEQYLQEKSKVLDQIEAVNRELTANLPRRAKV